MDSPADAAGALSFEHVLLPGGLERGRRITFDGNGRIIRIENAPTGSRDGFLAVPGMPNAHSHAFQRALVGYTEVPAGRDSFWTWRETMYELAATLTPEDMFVVASQAYADMLVGGFTSVAEFHYLHHARDGSRGTEMADALCAAAQAAGIRLALLPVLYMRGGFDRAPAARQQRFVHTSVEHYARLLQDLGDRVAGVAAHSLRAVAPEQIRALLTAAGPLLGDECPVHIHIAEQTAEVEECRRLYGRGPVALLCDEVGVDERWHLVHATHADDAERAAIVAAGASVVLCPLTEAYLGDGIFPARDFMQHGGAFSIGSDSNARIDAIEELRTLEYGQRLVARRRLCLAGEGTMASALWARSARAGAAALAAEVGAIEEGRYCDLVVLDETRPPLAGVAPERLLDAWLTGGSAAHVADVYVGGRRQVADGTATNAPGARFAATLDRLLH